MHSHGPVNGKNSNSAQMRSLHNNTVTGNKRGKQLVSSSLNMAPSSAAHTQSSYAAMRMSHQGFGTGQGPSNLNSSLMLGLQGSTDVNALELNNTGVAHIAH